MLQSSWSLKLSQVPRVASVAFLPHPCIPYQGNSNQLYIHTENQCTPFPLRKQIISIGSLPSSHLICLTRYQLLCLDLLTNNQLFVLQFEHAHGLTLSASNIFVHCGADLFVYNHHGEEQYVAHFSAMVNTVVAMGEEAVVGLNDNSLLRCRNVNVVLDYGKIIGEPVSIVGLEVGMMVGTKEGIVAYYIEGKKPKWRAKSSLQVHRVLAYGEHAFVVRVEGQIEMKDWRGKGETISKIKVGERLIWSGVSDYRERRVYQVMCVLESGHVKAFNIKESATANTTANIEEDNMSELLREKMELEHEVQVLRELLRTSSEQVGESSEELSCEVQLQHDENGLVLRISVKGGYASGIVFQETIQPYFCERGQVVRYVFQNEGIKGGQLTIYILLHRTFTSKKCVIKVVRINLPLFWKWAMVKAVSSSVVAEGHVKFSGSERNTVSSSVVVAEGYVKFSGSERNARYLKWLNQCFFLNITQEELTALENMKSMRVRMHNAYAKQQLEMVFCGQQNRVEFHSDCLATLGALFQDLMEYVGIKDLDSELCFPKEKQQLKQQLETIERLTSAKASISSEMAGTVEEIKFLLVKGQSARVVADMKEFRKSHTEVMVRNRSLLLEIEKKQANSRLLTEALKEVGKIINLTANVRFGKAKEIVVARCREAIKKKEFPKIISIMERGASSNL